MLIKREVTFMGVRRLWARGGQKFSKGGGPEQKHTFSLKNILFFSKKYKNITFLAAHGGGGGAEPPLAYPPPDSHGNLVKLQLYFLSLNYHLL